MIIFDFDGTLADTISLGLTIVNFYSEKFKYKKIDLEKNAGLSAMELIKVAQIKIWKLPYFVAFLRKRIAEKAPEIQIFPGVKDLIEDLNASGQQLGILTSNSSATVLDFLKRNGIASCFSYIKGGVPVFGKKKALLKAKKQLKTDFLYVGDEIRDVEACHKTNTSVVSVAWGFNSADSLEKINPSNVARTPLEAGTLIHKVAQL